MQNWFEIEQHTVYYSFEYIHAIDNQIGLRSWPRPTATSTIAIDSTFNLSLVRKSTK